MKNKALDLTKQFPESPRKIMGGYVHLARMRDKARAKAAGTVGEYIYPCPLDKRLLEFLEINDAAFYEAAQKLENAKLADWISQKARKRSPEEIHQWNEMFLSRQPDNPESLQYFVSLRNKIAPEREGVKTWVDLLDLEEGRPAAVSRGK
jgi:hypothetical protein